MATIQSDKGQGMGLGLLPSNQPPEGDYKSFATTYHLLLQYGLLVCFFLTFTVFSSVHFCMFVHYFYSVFSKSGVLLQTESPSGYMKYF